jgi:hypothetical protein
VQSVNVLLEMV